MKKLHELVRIVTRRRQKEIELFDPADLTDNNPYHRLFRLIQEKEIPEETDAAHILQGTGPRDKKYQMFKSRFMNRLLNMCFFLDVSRSGSSEYIRAIYECDRRLSLCHIIGPLGARHTVLHLARRGLKQALHYELTRQAIEYSRILIIHYSQQGNRKEFDKMHKINMEQFTLYTAENRIMNFFSGIICDYSTSTTIKPQTIPQIREFLKREIQLTQQLHLSFNYKLYKFRLHMYLYDLSKDHKSCINTCIKAEAFLNEHPHLHGNKPVVEFGLQKMYCHIYLNKLKEAGKVAQQYYPLIEKDAPYWLKASEYYFRFLMKNGAYKEAANIIYEVGKSKKLFTQPEAIIEKWHIFTAYLRFAQEAGWYDNKQNTGWIRFPAFRLSKFLNEVAIYSKDKAGLNISVLIIQFLFLLKREKHEKIVDTMDQLKLYNKRHINDTILPRTSAFIKILLYIYNRGLSQGSHGANPLKLPKTLSLPSNESDQYDECELLDYNKLLGHLPIQ